MSRIRTVCILVMISPLLSVGAYAQQPETRMEPAILECRTTPPGAAILVGHPHSEQAYRKGTTPATVEVLSVTHAPREVRVTFALEGYEPWSKILALSTGDRVSLDIRLEPKRTMVFVGSGSLMTADSDGKNVRTLFPIKPPYDLRPCSWNPDGTAFTFVSAGTICVGSLRSTEPRVVVSADDVAKALSLPKTACSAPQWSADGQWIAFLAQSDGLPALFVVPAQGGKPIQVADNITSPPRWSAAGQLAASGPGQMTIWDMTAEGPKVSSQLRGASDPSWSPDGSRLAFAMAGELFVADPLLRTLAQITASGGAGPRSPVWSSDGKIVVCVIRRALPDVEPWDELWAIYPGTNVPASRLASGEQGFGERRYLEPGGFTPDGRRFVFASVGSGEVSVVGLDGTGPSLLVIGAGLPSWSGGISPPS